jgi:C4-dicarboxylate transporter DctM subunit
MVLAVLGSFGLFFLLGSNLSSQIQVALQAYRAVDSFTLEAVPLFVMAASLFAYTRLTDGLFDIAKSWLSFLPANLLMATITCCAIFAAITGSSVANAATIGLVTIGPMLAANYEKGISLGAVAAGGTLGILIPPSLSFILIGEICQLSVGQLFIAGIIPGIFISLVFMGYVYFKTRKDPRYKSTAYTWRDRIICLKAGGPVLLAPIIILGGIYSGLFTPTEAAAVSVMYAIFLPLTRRLNKPESANPETPPGFGDGFDDYCRGNGLRICSHDPASQNVANFIVGAGTGMGGHRSDEHITPHVRMFSELLHY